MRRLAHRIITSLVIGLMLLQDLCLADPSLPVERSLATTTLQVPTLFQSPYGEKAVEAAIVYILTKVKPTKSFPYRLAPTFTLSSAEVTVDVDLSRTVAWDGRFSIPCSARIGAHEWQGGGAFTLGIDLKALSATGGKGAQAIVPCTLADGHTEAVYETTIVFDGDDPHAVTAVDVRRMADETVASHTRMAMPPAPSHPFAPPGKITAVFFDIGNVILSFDFHKAARRLMPYCARTEDEIYRALTGDILTRLETAQTTPEEFFGEMCAELGLTIDDATFFDIFTDIFTLKEETAATIRGLKAAGYKIHIISNTNKPHADYILARYHDVFGLADGITTSFAAGMKKDDPRIFDRALAAAGVTAAESVFIDDIAAYADQAASRGMAAINLLPETDLAAALERLFSEKAPVPPPVRRGATRSAGEQALRDHLRATGRGRFRMPAVDQTTGRPVFPRAGTEIRKMVEAGRTLKEFVRRHGAICSVRTGEWDADDYHYHIGATAPYLFDHEVKRGEEQAFRILRYSEIDGPDGLREGTVLIYYDPHAHKIKIVLQRVPGIRPGSNTATLAISLKKRYGISRIIHEEMGYETADYTVFPRDMVLSPAMIAILMTDAGISHDLPALYAALTEALVLPEVTPAEREREAAENRIIPLSAVEHLMDLNGAALEERIAQLEAFAIYRSPTVTWYALNALQRLVREGRMPIDRLERAERVFMTDEVAENIALIRRLVIDEPTFAADAINNVFGVPVKKGEIKEVAVDYLDHGGYKNVYRVTFTLKNGQRYPLVCSAMKHRPSNSETSPQQTATIIEPWQRFSRGGSGLFARLGASIWYDDQRPGIADEKVDLDVCDDDAFRPSHWIRMRMHLVLREFVRGRDLGEIMDDGTLSGEEKHRAVGAALQAFCDCWNETKDEHGSGFYISDPKPLKVALDRDATGNYSGRLFDLDALRPGATFEELVRSLGTYPLYAAEGFMVKRDAAGNAIAVDTRTAATTAPHQPIVIAPAAQPPYLRDLKLADQLTVNLIESVISACLSHEKGKVALAFHERLTDDRHGGCAQVRVLLEALERLKEKPGFCDLLQNLVIVKEFASVAALRTELTANGVTPGSADDLVFMFAPDAEKEGLQEIASAVMPVFVAAGEGFDPLFYYYPLVEIVTVTLVKQLKMLRGALPDLAELNIGTIDDNDPDAFLVFRLIPRTRRYDANTHADRYNLIARYISAAA